MKGKTIFRISIILLLIFEAPLLFFSMEWPSQEAVLVRNFGLNDQGMPSLGTFFSGSGPFLAAEKGELIFYHGDGPLRLPSPLGNWMALDHGDGLISVYSRFGEDSFSETRQKPERNEELAASGQSGWSSEQGFYFSLFDLRERRWVNPSMIITPLPDSRPPVIQAVRLRNADGRLIDPSQTRNISQGRYTILVTASDTRTAANDPPLAPHRIVCSVNGTETGSLSFETYSTRDGVLMVSRNGLVPASQVYAPYPALETGEVWLTRGQATLEVIAQDIAANSRNVVYRLQVE
jgi:hypothetical protein